MERKYFFERLYETSYEVIPSIARLFNKLSNENFLLKNVFQQLVQKRIQPNQGLLRPFLARLGFELAGAKNWKDRKDFFALLEVFNISTYFADKVFDNQYTFTKEEERSNFFICSILSINTIFNYLASLINLENVKLKKILKEFCIVNDEIYKGQFIDLNILRINNLKMISSDKYLSIYLERCRYLGGSLTSLCLSTGYILGKSELTITYLKKIKNIGYIMGTARQILNDMSDLILLKNKNIKKFSYKEDFSDLKNGKLTYPIYHLFTHLNDYSLKKEILGLINNKKELNNNEKELIMSTLCKYGSFKSTRELIIEYYKKLKNEVQKLPNSKARDLLSLSFSTLLTNKFFATIREFGY
jgi:geranylgeranyl pyrophosphate synthase